MTTRQTLGIVGQAGSKHLADLERAAAAQNHRVIRHDWRNLEANEPNFQSTPDDALIIRSMPLGSLEQVVFRMDWLHAQESAGSRILNPPRALEISIDKYLCTHRLRNAGLAVPRTVVCQTADQAMNAYTLLGSNVVIKPLFGSEGRGMVHITDPETAWRVCTTLERLQAVIYLQEFLPHPGWDVRLWVLQNRVLGAIQRHATAGMWRTNISLGGTPAIYPLTPELEHLGLASAKAVGAVAAGVDAMLANGIWYLLEVNAVPGWQGFAKVTGIDVAAEVVRTAMAG